jgi:uncharacterized protein with HEPN domain
MLPNEKNDLMYLLNILEYIGKIWKYTEETNDAEELFELNDQLNLNASLALLANIGENVSKITEKLKQKYPDIEWQQIKNFRNKIVHDYVGIDLAIVYEIITNNLKILKPEFEKIIKEQTNLKIFDIEEIKLCKESRFYKYIDFEKIIL